MKTYTRIYKKNRPSQDWQLATDPIFGYLPGVAIGTRITVSHDTEEYAVERIVHRIDTDSSSMFIDIYAQPRRPYI